MVAPHIEDHDFSPELKAALDAAEQAAVIARSLYQHNLEVRIKADKSPVTEADVRCEIAIREILESRFPAYGFFGEETGSRDEGAESLWLVDPIDGTKAFVREYPLFSTQIALMRRGEIVLGVSSAPVYGELALCRARRRRVSERQAHRGQPGVGTGVGGALRRKHEDAGHRRAMGPRMASSWRVWAASAATAISCITICWRPGNRRGDRDPTSISSTSRRAPPSSPRRGTLHGP